MAEFLPVAAGAIWPQDALQIPAAMPAMMPPLAPGNKHLIHREAVIYSNTQQTSGTPAFTLGTLPPGGQVTTTIPTDQDGDFWCNQIFLTAFATVAGANPNTPLVLPYTLGISDVRTGQSLTYGNTDPPLEFYRNTPILGDPFDVPNAWPYPNGFRLTSTLPQPFCFTRQGGIQLVFTSFTSATGPIMQLSVAFSGWKEYVYGGA